MKKWVHSISFLLIGLAFTPGNKAGAQVMPPEPLCASVNDDGSVELFWTLPGVGPSYEYQIFRDGVPLVPTLNNLQNTFTDVGANANAASVPYTLQTVGPQNSELSQEIRTIHLELSAILLGSVAVLDWNEPFDNMPTGDYKIQRRFQGQPVFETIASLPSGITTYSDTLYSLCVEENISYRVSFVRPECVMNSNVQTDEFQDLYGPTPPTVETITVDPLTGDVTLFWLPDTEPDLNQYGIQNELDIPLGFVPEGTNSFTLFGAAINQEISLKVRSIDDCGLDQGSSPLVTTMLVQAEFDRCALEVSLDWSPYEGWNEGVASYEVRANVDGAEDILFADLNPSQTEYVADVEPNREYIFYIEANSNGTQQPSRSNGAALVSSYPVIIDYHYLSSVSVTGADEITVTLYQDPDGEGTRYEVFRSVDDGSFQLIRTLNAPEEEVISIVDTDVNTDGRVYTYYWRAYDGCGVLIGDSNRGNSIVLNVDANNQLIVNSLFWNDYEGWENGVAEYRILRSLGNAEDFQDFDQLPPNELSWEEDVEEFRLEEGQFCYVVEAREASSPFGENGISRSNIACAVQEPIMWIPNTIVINGFNKEFKPVGGFIDFESYRMEIYNKWGERLFSSDDIEMGWNGSYKGDYVPEDYYRYIIQYRDSGGKPFTEEGVLYVLKN